MVRPLEGEEVDSSKHGSAKTVVVLGLSFNGRVGMAYRENDLNDQLVEVAASRRPRAISYFACIKCSLLRASSFCSAAG
jgi:hypothetical protein